MSDDPNTRTTSHAKTVDLGGHETALDRARSLKDAFNGSKVARERAHVPEKARMPDPVDRTTSFAKALDAKTQKTALERTLPLRQQFVRANVVPTPGPDQEKSHRIENARGTAYAPKAEPHLRPEGEIRRAVDKQIDNEQREKERQRAKALSEACKERHEQKKTMDLNRDRRQGRHPGH